MEVKKESKKDRKKILALVLGMIFVWANFSWADENGLGYFDDRDGDGLTDKEELLLGTDPEKGDSDGDGYGDGVEVQSGYDPLKAAPGDRLAFDEQTTVEQTTQGVNLTEEFFNQLAKEKPKEWESLKAGVVSEEEESGGIISETDINQLVQQVIAQNDDSGELEMIPLEEFNILEEVKGSEEEKKEVYAQQIEDYSAAVTFIVGEYSPIDINNGEIEEDVLISQIKEFVGLLEEDVELKKEDRIKDLREKGEVVNEKMKEVAVPFVLREIHQEGASILQYSLQQKEELLLNGNDPMGAILLLGKMEAIMKRGEDFAKKFDEVMKEYSLFEEEDEEDLEEE